MRDDTQHSWGDDGASVIRRKKDRTYRLRLRLTEPEYDAVLALVLADLLMPSQAIGRLALIEAERRGLALSAHEQWVADVELGRLPS